MRHVPRPRTTHVFLLAVLIALAGSVMVPAAFDGTPAASAAGDCTVDASLDADELAFLTLINNYRAQNGLAPVQVSYTLSRAAAWKSKDMADNAYFAHDELNRTWVQRVRDCNYGFNAYIGENIAAGYPNAQAVFDGWKASPGHNANMLGANYTAIGIGKYAKSGSPYGTYWTTEFASFSDGWVDALADSPAPFYPDTVLRRFANARRDATSAGRTGNAHPIADDGRISDPGLCITDSQNQSPKAHPGVALAPRALALVDSLTMVKA